MTLNAFLFLNRRKKKSISKPTNVSICCCIQVHKYFCLIHCVNSFISVILRLNGVSIEAADYSSTGRKLASPVELCDCPPGYAGTSCEVSITIQTISNVLTL